MSKDNTKSIFSSTRGAIDLASIMVGIIVIGIIGGVIGATVYAVVPWAQDNAAKGSLDAVRTAQNVYAGFQADPNKALGQPGPELAFINPFPGTVPAIKAESGSVAKYASYTVLQNEKLLPKQASDILDVAVGENKTCYAATALSDSGKLFWIDSSLEKAKEYSDNLSASCSSAAVTIPDEFRSSVMALNWGNTAIAACKTAKLPLSNGVDVSIDWGDGTTQSYTTDNPTHVYDTAKPYDIRITGTFGTWTGGNNVSTTSYSSQCVNKVTEWHGTETTNLRSAFQKAVNLTEVKEIPSTVTNTAFMFSLAPQFNDPNVSNWNVDNVNTMMGMFYAARAFNQPLNDWNVSKAEYTTIMFEGATSFNQPLNNWDVSGVLSFTSMFEGATAYNQDISSWNTGKATTMVSMFRNASAFNQNLSGWNVASTVNSGTTKSNFATGSPMPANYIPNFSE